MSEQLRGMNLLTSSVGGVRRTGTQRTSCASQKGPETQSWGWRTDRALWGLETEGRESPRGGGMARTIHPEVVVLLDESLEEATEKTYWTLGGTCFRTVEAVTAGIRVTGLRQKQTEQAEVGDAADSLGSSAGNGRRRRGQLEA